MKHHFPGTGPLRYTVGEGAPQLMKGAGEIVVPAGQTLRVILASGGLWYGHGFSHRQPLPLNGEAVVNETFAVNNTQTPMWLCSAGYVLLASTWQALSVRLNADAQGLLELTCATEELRVQVFHGRTLPAAHAQALRHLGWPNPLPAEDEFFGPSIFCTWTQWPMTLTQARVLDFAHQIRAQDFPVRYYTIDQQWETVVGDLAFNPALFPQPRAMMDELHALGFKVLLWVTPFVNRESPNFAFLGERGWLVRQREADAPAVFRWWGGQAGLIDLSHPDAYAWLRTRLLELQRELGFDGFKIDGGDAKYQPAPATSRWHDFRGPSAFNDHLLRLFSEVSPGYCETRTAWLAQSRPVLWRQGGKDSHWGIDNGLKAVVTYGLQMALLGYDVAIPDMIPGRVLTMDVRDPLPTDELMVRWTEVSTFFPIMQFAYFPWNYAPATSEICRQYAQLHVALQPYLLAQATARVRPLLRPLWYDAPRRAELYTVNDAFQLGDDLLVYPALNEAQLARDILLPPGLWRDAWTGEVLAGRLLQHPTPCPGIALFVRRENQALYGALHPILSGIARGTILPRLTTATFRAGTNRDLSVTG